MTVIEVSSDRAGSYYRRDNENGDIAQLGERCVRIAEVGGSNPPISTNAITQGHELKL